MISGDFHHHSELSAPFFPTTKREGSRLTLEAVPLTGPIRVRAGIGMGTGDLILEHAKTVTGKPMAPVDRGRP